MASSPAAFRRQHRPPDPADDRGGRRRTHHQHLGNRAQVHRLASGRRTQASRSAPRNSSSPATASSSNLSCPTWGCWISFSPRASRRSRRLPDRATSPTRRSDGRDLRLAQATLSVVGASSVDAAVAPDAPAATRGTDPPVGPLARRVGLTHTPDERARQAIGRTRRQRAASTMRISGKPKPSSR